MVNKFSVFLQLEKFLEEDFWNKYYFPTPSFANSRNQHSQKNYLKPGVIWHKTFLHKWRKLYAAPKLEKNTNNQQQLKQEIHTTTANAKFRPILQHKLLLGKHKKQMGRE